jgi:hypothetical protein
VGRAPSVLARPRKATRAPAIGTAQATITAARQPCELTSGPTAAIEMLAPAVSARPSQVKASIASAPSTRAWIRRLRTVFIGAQNAPARTAAGNIAAVPPTASIGRQVTPWRTVKAISARPGAPKAPERAP